jgi:hypothetical protein
MIKIIRQNRGRAKTRFGILLKNLAPRYQRILFNNPIISKNSMDDRFILCLFKMEDDRIKVSYLERPFINPETREISTYSEIKKTYRILDWECAYCKTPIKSKINYFKADNFTCSKCYTYYVKDLNSISQIILKSMVNFTDYYKRLLKENQQKFLKYIKKNEKKSSVF